jgi:hypothetical protein
MSNFIVNISGGIKTKLESVSHLKAVYDRKPDKPEDGKYPYAVVTVESFEGRFGDTQRNIRTTNFGIRVYQERTQAGFGNEKAERVIRELMDEIFTAFDNDTTLSGMVSFIKPAGGDLTYDTGEVGDMRICEFILEATYVVDSLN